MPAAKKDRLTIDELRAEFEVQVARPLVEQLWTRYLRRLVNSKKLLARDANKMLDVPLPSNSLMSEIHQLANGRRPTAYEGVEARSTD